jgi:hypothetical protein
LTFLGKPDTINCVVTHKVCDAMGLAFASNCNLA